MVLSMNRESTRSAFAESGAIVAGSQDHAADANPAAGGPILFFDGVCGLCNRFVDFALPRDAGHALRFAPLQGETARRHLATGDVESLKSLVLLDERGSYRYSSAVVRTLKHLGPGWKMLGTILWLVPRPLRDGGYRLVAANRYRLFGKKQACRLPSPQERPRFLP